MRLYNTLFIFFHVVHYLFEHTRIVELSIATVPVQQVAVLMELYER